jgi:hypothetical protein
LAYLIVIIFIYDHLLGVITTPYGSTTSGAANGVGTNAKFNAPLSVTINVATGILYLPDFIGNTIRAIDTISGKSSIITLE